MLAITTIINILLHLVLVKHLFDCCLHFQEEVKKTTKEHFEGKYCIWKRLKKLELFGLVKRRTNLLTAF